MQQEKIIQNKIMVALSELGCIPVNRDVGLFYTQNAIPIHIGVKGEPDLQVFAPNGKTIYMEVKTDTGEQSNDQIIFAETIKELGHKVYVVRSVDEAIRIFNYEMQN